LWFKIPEGASTITDHQDATENKVVLFNDKTLSMNSLNWTEVDGYPANILKVTV